MVRVTNLMPPAGVRRIQEWPIDDGALHRFSRVRVHPFFAFRLALHYAPSLLRVAGKSSDLHLLAKGSRRRQQSFLS